MERQEEDDEGNGEGESLARCLIQRQQTAQFQVERASEGAGFKTCLGDRSVLHNNISFA